ncbi:MAG: hypothetical protein C5B48_02605, partial [Candidatus Rokuibacteriota bacterium]
MSTLSRSRQAFERAIRPQGSGWLRRGHCWERAQPGTSGVVERVATEDGLFFFERAERRRAASTETKASAAPRADRYEHLRSACLLRSDM